MEKEIDLQRLETLEHISDPLGYLTLDQLEQVKKATLSGEIFLHGISENALLFLGEEAGFFILIKDEDENFLKVNIPSFSGLKDEVYVENILPEKIVLKRVFSLQKPLAGEIVEDFFVGNFTGEKVEKILTQKQK